MFFLISRFSEKQFIFPVFKRVQNPILSNIGKVPNVDFDEPILIRWVLSK